MQMVGTSCISTTPKEYFRHTLKDILLFSSEISKSENHQQNYSVSKSQVKASPTSKTARI